VKRIKSDKTRYLLAQYSNKIIIENTNEPGGSMFDDYHKSPVNDGQLIPEKKGTESRYIGYIHIVMMLEFTHLMRATLA